MSAEYSPENSPSDSDLDSTPPGGLRLDTFARIRAEQGRLYRSSRKGAGPEPSPRDAYRLSMILNSMSRNLELAELEQRIEALEKG